MTDERDSFRAVGFAEGRQKVLGDLMALIEAQEAQYLVRAVTPAAALEALMQNRTDLVTWLQGEVISAGNDLASLWADHAAALPEGRKH